MHRMCTMLLLSQLLSTLTMTGLIWFVQVVHYPLFLDMPGRGFAGEHARRTTWVVGPPMLLELASGVALLRPGWRPTSIPAWQTWLGAALIGLIWLSTGLLQVPLHTRLQAKPTQQDAQHLVATNWIRTLLWSARAVLVLVWAMRALSPVGFSLQ